MNSNKIMYIADDDDLIRSLVGKIFRGTYDVCEFEDGPGLVGAYDKQKPDIIVTDNDMPHLNGVGVIRHVRETVGDDMTPILLITGRSGSKEIDYVRSLNKVTILEKPFGIEDIKDAISRLE